MNCTQRLRNWHSAPPAERLLRSAQVKTGEYNVESIPNLDVANYTVDSTLQPDMSITDMIGLAVDYKASAHRLYTDLAANCEDAKLKDLFVGMAAAELSHKGRLDMMYDEYISSQDGGKMWSQN